MLDLIARHERFIKSFHVSLYEQEGEMLRFKAQLTFTNKSKLFIKEYVFENKERKYAYHWTDSSGNMKAPEWCAAVQPLDEPFSVISPENRSFWEDEKGNPIFAKRNIFAPEQFMFFL
ncbi:MAG: hypothetical protein LWW97_11220 [Deltaproteobacteria bacterium]|nr:hypothetical protein [Deltaproteobacteria bacterium]